MQAGALPHDPVLTFEGIEVTFASAQEGDPSPAPQVYDLVLQAVGRTPIGKKIAADKAVHEAHVAAEVIAGELQGNKELAAAAFNARRACSPGTLAVVHIPGARATAVGGQ